MGDEVKGLSPLGYSLMRPLARPRSALALGAGAITSYSLGPEAFRQIVNSWRDDEAAPHPT
ncbi:MAG TPA: hypothetical protein VEZ44_13730 [bacterium]|nr:hypothetical protein [bacterium]